MVLCTCDTKTPELKYHSEACAYRKYMELRAERDLYKKAFEYMHDRADKAEMGICPEDKTAGGGNKPCPYAKTTDGVPVGGCIKCWLEWLDQRS